MAISKHLHSLRSLSSSPIYTRRIPHKPCPSNYLSTKADHSASSKLFADAEAEKAEERNQTSSKLAELLEKAEHKNWDGEESIQDTVLRMLVDKHKPVRTGHIRTADEKLKDPFTSPAKVPAYGADLGALPPLQPPRAIPPQSGPSKSSLDSADHNDSKARAEARRIRKLNEGAGRLGKAFEKSLDYRVGKFVEDHSGTATPSSAKTTGDSAKSRPNPVSMQGWAGLIEDRIEKARKKGLFDNLAGSGQPLTKSTDESNPFIAREEFLMNRLVQRNGASPPWVEVQADLERNVQMFREVMRSNWVRRATRNILMSLPPPPHRSHSFTIESISKMRDTEWEAKESAYHEAALKDVNDQIRRHNGIAPYAARRPYLMKQYELERCYESAAEEVLERVEQSIAEVNSGNRRSLLDETTTQTTGSLQPMSLGVWKTIRRMVSRMMSSEQAEKRPTAT